MEFLVIPVSHGFLKGHATTASGLVIHCPCHESRLSTGRKSHQPTHLPYDFAIWASFSQAFDARFSHVCTEQVDHGKLRHCSQGIDQ